MSDPAAKSDYDHKHDSCNGHKRAPALLVCASANVRQGEGNYRLGANPNARSKRSA